MGTLRLLFAESVAAELAPALSHIERARGEPWEIGQETPADALALALAPGDLDVARRDPAAALLPKIMVSQSPVACDPDDRLLFVFDPRWPPQVASALLDGVLTTHEKMRALAEENEAIVEIQHEILEAVGQRLRQGETLEPLVTVIGRAPIPRRGASPALLADVDINELVSQTVHRITPRFVDEAVALEVSVDPELPQVRGRRRPLAHVLVNLFEEARFALQEAPRGHGRVRLRARREANGVAVLVEDNAPKRASAELEGLSISRRIAEDYGGELTLCESSLGGAAFRLWLPSPS